MDGRGRNDTDNALPARCPHAQVVHRVDRIAAVTPVFRGGGRAEFESALESLPAGSLNESTLIRNRNRIRQAQEEGVPFALGIPADLLRGTARSLIALSLASGHTSSSTTATAAA